MNVLKGLYSVWIQEGVVDLWITRGARKPPLQPLGHAPSSVSGRKDCPEEEWNVTMEDWGFLAPGQYLIHDRDGKFCPAFQRTIDEAGMIRVVLPPRSPNLNADPERWVRSVKEECLERLMLFGEASLRHMLTQYVEHFHHERPHQGKGNVLLFPLSSPAKRRTCPIQCRARRGGHLES